MDQKQLFVLQHVSFIRAVLLRSSFLGKHADILYTNSYSSVIILSHFSCNSSQRNLIIYEK